MRPVRIFLSINTSLAVFLFVIHGMGAMSRPRVRKVDEASAGRTRLDSRRRSPYISLHDAG